MTLFFDDKSIVLFACDVSQHTGEGFLANAVLAKLPENRALYVYNDPIVTWLRLYSFARDRLLPLYLTWVIALHLLARKRCVLLNYTPAWNFINAALTRLGLRLGPITGSIGVIPELATNRQSWMRGTLQDCMVRMTCYLLPPDRLQWAATPTVRTVLSATSKFPVVFGFPSVLCVSASPAATKRFDYFFYSNAHPIKNHGASLLLAEQLARAGYRLCCIGDGFSDLRGDVTAYRRVDEAKFNSALAASKVFVSTSYEDAGITAIKALANGVPILCPQQSGMAVMAQGDPRWCYPNPYNTSEVFGRAVELLNESATDAQLAQQRFLALKADADNAFTSWERDILTDV